MLASNLRRWALRRELLPVDHLARRSGVSVSQLYAMLRARVSSSIDRLVPLSQTLEVPSHVLLEIDKPGSFPR